MHINAHWRIKGVFDNNVVVVFIRKNCIRMVFVYFAFWGLQEEFSTLPCSPCITSLLVKFVYKLGKNWQTRAWDHVFKTAGSASDAAICVKKTFFVYFNNVFRTGGPF
jgi:hypothetical protein